ncbi:hypothetical protein O181_125133 [Austropuccinia psidii MF-1]|uniref:Tf2-1-like SH3-like domain-containing protein n=1 Tax=Austropuccinia psidii MF-1 TaxID=1389203 RepID=A0A9Q3KP52_9BASI|nr:hypothetical protein [Austropuccinia psidii MF-1]
MIQTLEDMIRRFCAYGLELKDSDGFTHYWCTLIPATHKVPDFKVGDLVLVSTLNFDYIKGPKKLKDSYVGPFFIVALHGTNAVQVEFSGELQYKHPTFPVSLMKPYQPADKELFPLRNPTPFTLPAVEESEDKQIRKVIRERRLRG